MTYVETDKVVLDYLFRVIGIDHTVGAFSSQLCTRLDIPQLLTSSLDHFGYPSRRQTVKVIIGHSTIVRFQPYQVFI